MLLALPRKTTVLRTTAGILQYSLESVQLEVGKYVFFSNSDFVWMFTDISDRIHSLLWCDSGRPPPRCKEKRIENDLCFESRRLRKHSIVRRIEEKTFSTPDGVTLHVRVIKGAPGSPLALLASPLGFEDTSIFWPLIDHFGKRYTFVNWSYRGLFSSGMPRRSRKISIRDHANDAADVIKACGFENAEVVIGHSMVGCSF